jgi:hypothetical protein
MKLLMKLDKHIFSRDNKRHPWQLSEVNLHDNFVDFTKLPKDLSREQKALLYRPEKLAQLAKGYKAICLELNSNYQRKKERHLEREIEKIVALNKEYRRFPKPQREIDIAEKVFKALTDFTNKTDSFNSKMMSVVEKVNLKLRDRMDPKTLAVLQ